jgi:hypothetical protein
MCISLKSEISLILALVPIARNNSLSDGKKTTLDNPTQEKVASQTARIQGD